MEGDDFQKIGQMFDQILIDYCNPETRIGGICLRICGNERQCFFRNSYFVILRMRKIQSRIIQNNNIIILNFPALPSAKSKRAGIFINFLWICTPSFFINTLLPITFLVEGENWKKREVNPPYIYRAQMSHFSQYICRDLFWWFEWHILLFTNYLDKCWL